jgi:ribosomal protein S19E (S16A)
MQLEAAGLVGTAKYVSEEGVQIVIGKSLTKKGTTDMDRIAAGLIKELKKN